MKVVHVSRSDIGGGAARAAYRVHKSLCHAGVDSRMRVRYGISGDSRIKSGPAEGVGPLGRRIRSRAAQWLIKHAAPARGGTHSAAWPDTGLGRELETSGVDIVNLHWIGTDTLSVEEIGRLSKPVVWRLADMWAFCGAEHYASDSSESRFRTGYARSNAPDRKGWFDLNRWVWERKRRHWRRPIHIVCTSRWSESCVKQSALMRNWPVSVIPNALDLKKWRPMDKAVARAGLGLEQSARIVLFGAPGGLNDPRKGGDLALAALERLAATPKRPDQLVIFGQDGSRTTLRYPLPVKFLGRLGDDQSLVAAYSAADLLIMPSRIESFGQIASEAMACGTPVVAFDTGGLPDIVDHRRTGWLAEALDVEDLAAGISWVLNDPKRLSVMRLAARATAEERFCEVVVAAKYVALYEYVLDEHLRASGSKL